MAKSKNDYTFDDIKAMLLKEKKKYDWEKTVEVDVKMIKSIRLL